MERNKVEKRIKKLVDRYYEAREEKKECHKKMSALARELSDLRSSLSHLFCNELDADVEEDYLVATDKHKYLVRVYHAEDRSEDVYIRALKEVIKEDK